MTASSMVGRLPRRSAPGRRPRGPGASPEVAPPPAWRRSARPRCCSPLVFAAQFGFGLWMASRGFRWGDAFYRSASALFVLHSSDAKLANIGFVWMPLPALLNLPWAALYSGVAGRRGQRRRLGRRRARCAGGATAALLA